jgi:hypothetical protein
VFYNYEYDRYFLVKLRNIHIPLAAVIVFENVGVRPELDAADMFPATAKIQVVPHVAHPAIESASAVYGFCPVFQRYSPFSE